MKSVSSFRSGRPVTGVFWLGVAMAVFLCGCGEEDGAECSINSDCPAGEVCSAGDCIVECREERDCPAGLYCNRGRCEQVFGNDCSDDTQCLVGQACIQGVCQPVDASDDLTTDTGDDTGDDALEMSDDVDMAEDDGDQEEDAPQDTGMDTPQDMGMDTPQDMGMDMPQDMGMDTPQDMGMDMMDMSCPPKNGQYLDPCACAAQCGTGLCLGDVSLGAGFCTRTCTSRSQCRSGQDACINAGGGQFVCAPDDTGTSCYSNGTPTPTDCLLRTCVNSAGAQATPEAFCALPCSTAADCLPAHACAPVRCRDLGTNELECLMTIVPFLSASKEQILTAYPIQSSACVPIAQPNACAANGDEAVCPSAICCGPGGGCSGSFCTGQCLDGMDCPAGQCIAQDTSDPRIPIGVCIF